jgi:CysZ protein
VGGTVIKNGLTITEGLINKYGVSQQHGELAYYFVAGLLGFLFFILASWTFVVMVGILAAPFNDVISRRIEKKIRGDIPSQDKKAGIREVFRGLGRTLMNEFKKLTVIIMFTLAAVSLNFIPVLFPVAMVLLALLMSSQFLDYSWSRHDMTVRACVKDLLGSPFANILSGMMFLMLVSVPLLNALVPALATSFYTVLWTRRQPMLNPPSP